MKYLFFVLFSSLFFAGSAFVASAQSCSGVITCCNTMGNIYTPSGCSISCNPLNLNCTPCVGEPRYGCTSTGTVQSCSPSTLPSGAITCGVPITCNYGSEGACSGGAPAPTSRPAATATPRPPTITTMPGTPTPTPRPNPTNGPPTSCSQGSPEAGPLCSGTGVTCGSWSGGICCCTNNPGFLCVQPGIVAQAGTPQACGYKCPGDVGVCTNRNYNCGPGDDACAMYPLQDCCTGTQGPWIGGKIYNTVMNWYEGYWDVRPGLGNRIQVVGSGEIASYEDWPGEDGASWIVAKAAPPPWRTSNQVATNPPRWSNNGETVTLRFTPRPGFTCGTWSVYYFDWNVPGDNVRGPTGSGCVATIQMQSGTNHPRLRVHNRVDFTMTNASCSVSFVNPPTAIVRNAPPVGFGLRVNPTGQAATSARVDVVTGNGVVISGPQPAGPWSTSTLLNFTASAPFNAAPNVSLRGVVEMRDASNTLLAQCSTTDVSLQVKNQNTSFFLTGGGGDIVAAASGSNGGLKSSLANPDATIADAYYLAHNPKPIALSDLGITFASSYTNPLNSGNINSRGWAATLGGTAWEIMRDKRENTYDAMKERVLAKLTAAPYATNSMTEVLNRGNQACTPATCVAGVHIIEYGGAFGPAAIDIGNRKVMLFSDNGGVTTIQGPISVGTSGFFAFFTRGPITVADLVGEPQPNTDITAAAYPAHLAGVYFTDSDFNFGGGTGVSLCTAVPTPTPPGIFDPNAPGMTQCFRQIRVDGTIVAMKEIKFNRRHLGDKPAEYIRFRPDFAYQLYLIGLRSKVYQELLAP